MTTYIALLRGINVGGHNKIIMANLRQQMLGSGFLNVTTYIQSGNLIFQSSKTKAQLTKDIKDVIAVNYDIDIPVIVKSRSEFLNIFNTNPFNESQIEKCYFILLNKI